MRKTRVWLALVAGTALLGGLIWWIFVWQPIEKPTQNVKQPTQAETTPALDSTLTIGDPNAPLTIIEYSDYKCPECNKFYRAAGAELRRQYVDTGKAKIVFRMYPVFGEDAGLALYGSYCAADQGVFSAYHDAMFAYVGQLYDEGGGYESAAKNILTKEVVASVARGVVKDESLFSSCLSQKTHQAEFDAVMLAAAKDSVQGTPTVMVGTQKVVGNQPYEVYRTLLEILGAGR